MNLQKFIPRWADIDSNFSLSPDNTIKLDHDIAAVMDSLDNILGTYLFERVMLPDFPGDLLNPLFEPLDEFSLVQTSDSIKNTVERWDDRITVQTLEFHSDPANNYVTLTVLFSIKESPDVLRFVKTFFNG